MVSAKPETVNPRPKSVVCIADPRRLAIYMVSGCSLVPI